VLLGVAGFTVLALSVRHASTPTSWEHPIVTAADYVRLPLRDYLSAIFDPLPFALISIPLALAAGARGRAHLAIPGLGGCLAAVITTELVLKPLIDRMRMHSFGVHHRIGEIGGPMFPSAHVTAAAAWATFAWLIVDKRSRLKPAIVALPFLVGWAVMSKQMHYPADVLGGLIVGPTVVYCVMSAVRVANRWVDAPVVEHERVNVTN
jgi:membrane-associated phospholipid phosphatase